MSTRFWLGLLPLISFVAGTAEAATLTVNTEADFDVSTITDSSNELSFRAAIQILNAPEDMANSEACADVGSLCDSSGGFDGNNTIRISSDLIGDTINLNSKLEEINSNVVIEVQGANTSDRVTIRRDSTDPFRIFKIGSKRTVTLRNLTITNGSTQKTPEVAEYIGFRYGGGVFTGTSSTLSITNSTITNNVATGRAGGLFAYGKSITTITDSTISNNTVIGSGGGGIDHEGLELRLENVVLSNNRSNGFDLGGGGYGGGLYVNTSSETIHILNSTISGNTSANKGGGVSVRGGSLIITDSTVENNTSPNGGGIEVRGNSVRVISEITDSIITNNQASAGVGGGIFVNGSNTNTVTVTNSTISSNIASSGGGAISSTSTSSNVVVNSSTISDNQATTGSGGGIQATAGRVDITNSTISGNRANSGNGGGINSNSSVIRSSTITGNSAATGGGIAGPGANDTFFVLNSSIVAGNTATGAGNDISGSVGTGGISIRANNLIGDPNSAGGLIDGTDGNIVGVGGSGTIPIAEVLNTSLAANNTTIQAGSSPESVLTHALITNSLALENAYTNTCSTMPVNGVDQRGVSRPQPAGTNCDIGAFEAGDLSPAPPRPPAPTPTPEPSPSPLPIPEPSPSPEVSPTPVASPTPTPSVQPTLTLTLDTATGISTIPLDGSPITLNRRELISINLALTSPADFPEPFEICTMLPVTLQELGIESDAVLDFFTATVNQVAVSDLESTEFPPEATPLPDVCPTDEAPNGAVILTLPNGLNAGDELEVVLAVPPVP